MGMRRQPTGPAAPSQPTSATQKAEVRTQSGRTRDPAHLGDNTLPPSAQEDSHVHEVINDEDPHDDEDDNDDEDPHDDDDNNHDENPHVRELADDPPEGDDVGELPGRRLRPSLDPGRSTG